MVRIYLDKAPWTINTATTMDELLRVGYGADRLVQLTTDASEVVLVGVNHITYVEQL